MTPYVGYGFNVKDISGKDLFHFIKDYGGDEEQIVHDVISEEKNTFDELTDEEKETLYNEVSDWIVNEHTMAEYIRNVINECEIQAGRIPVSTSVVECYEDYVVFENIRFIDDGDERCKRIKSADDFIEMVLEYLPGVSYFGNVYMDCEFIDCNFFME